MRKICTVSQKRFGIERLQSKTLEKINPRRERFANKRKKLKSKTRERITQIKASQEVTPKLEVLKKALVPIFPKVLQER